MSKHEAIVADSQNFYRCLQNYTENNARELTEWLEYQKSFSIGKQGLVGVLSSKEDREARYAFKVSQYINYLIHHEFVVMKGLNDMASYCPHFCKTYGMQMCTLDGSVRKSGNPFEKKGKHQIEKEVLLMELLDNAPKLCSYVKKSKKIDEEILYSTIKQVLMAISLAQRKKRFTHYDLHSDNVLMRRCDKDLVFLYVLDEDNQFLIPSMGHYPVIIDFGFSYISDMDEGHLWPSMGHTDVGFLSDRYDWVADPKLFLVSISNEIKDHRSTKKAKKLRKLVKNMFFPLKIEMDCGWDNSDDQSVAEYLGEMLDGYNTKSRIFDEYEHYCLDLIQSLIILPFEDRGHSNIYDAYKAFIEEFSKIEDQISSDFYNLYILKCVVDAARAVQVDYHYGESRKDAIINFRRKVFEGVDKVANFCNPKNIKFEKMLCSLLVLAKNMEGVYFRLMKEKMRNKGKEYSRLPLTSTEQIFGCIEANIPDRYEYTENTSVLVFDAIRETTYAVEELSADEISNLNDIHPLTRGTYLYGSRNSEQIRQE